MREKGYKCQLVSPKYVWIPALFTKGHISQDTASVRIINVGNYIKTPPFSMYNTSLLDASNGHFSLVAIALMWGSIKHAICSTITLPLGQLNCKEG